MTPKYLPPDCTDIIQPIDHSAVGNKLKKLINVERKAFMSQSETAFDEWAAMGEREKRIIYTHWVACAWEQLLRRQQMEGVTTFEQIFLQKGFTLPIDGSQV
jgi:hypothetical protein